MEYMNIKHPNIKFILKHKRSNYFSSVDVKLCHENKSTTTVYGKPTFS